MGDAWYKSNIYIYMNIWRVLDLRSHSCSNSPVDSLVLLLHIVAYLLIIIYRLFCDFYLLPFALNFWNHHLSTDRQFQWWPCTFQEGHQQKERTGKGCRVQKEIWLLDFWKHVWIRIAKVNGYTSHTTKYTIIYMVTHSWLDYGGVSWPHLVTWNSLATTVFIGFHVWCR